MPLAAGGEHNYTRYNPIYKELQVSPFHITEDIIGRETEKFLAFRPVRIY